jgi:hypothetical protein
VRRFTPLIAFGVVDDAGRAGSASVVSRVATNMASLIRGRPDGDHSLRVVLLPTMATAIEAIDKKAFPAHVLPEETALIALRVSVYEMRFDDEGAAAHWEKRGSGKVQVLKTDTGTYRVLGHDKKTREVIVNFPVFPGLRMVRATF